jgi:signal transduction histidine kinase
MCIDIEEFKEALRAKATKPENKEFNIRNAVGRAILYLNEFGERKNISIKQLFSPVLTIKIKGDERNLFTAFYNILNNAIKYSWTPKEDRRGHVSVQITENLKYVIVTIENRGVGINKEEIESGKIFMFGNRGDESQDRNRRGNGIGLWHAKNIIDQFGGEIKITSTAIDNTYYLDKKPFLTVVTIKLPINN